METGNQPHMNHQHYIFAQQDDHQPAASNHLGHHQHHLIHMKSHHFANYLEIEHSHSEPNRFVAIGGGARGPEIDDRIFDNYGRIVPAPGSTSTQADMPHEMMMGKIKPRNLDFFDFPHH